MAGPKLKLEQELEMEVQMISSAGPPSWMYWPKLEVEQTQLMILPGGVAVLDGLAEVGF